MKNLVLVESPAKAKTIEKYLGMGYKVLATYGHVRDLPKKEIGIDFENNYAPKYIRSGRATAITNIKKELVKADSVYIASDPDREGEAIGWHTAIALGLIDKNNKAKKGAVKLSRIVFNEITKDAVVSSLNNPRDINMDLVNSQQARRILDRLVGYKLTPLIWKKVRFGLSAGRVQSVAVRLVVERERERQNFIPEEFFEIYAYGKVGAYAKNIKINKINTKDKKEEELIPQEQAGLVKFKYSTKLKDKKKSIEVLEKSTNPKWDIVKIETKVQKKQPSPPLTTSLLQQASLNVLGFSAKRTMDTAQKLYEKGLITYMRTDSMNISESAIQLTRKFISKEYGEKYLSEKERRYKSKSKNAQEAHEAIRPSNANNTPANLDLSGDEAKLYELIWRRNIAIQMKEALVEKLVVTADASGNFFVAEGAKIKFDGYLKVAREKVAEVELPDMKEGDSLHISNIDYYEKHTKPPARYTEASLIKALEKEGIGRPSTYASIMGVITSRGYCAKEGKYFYPTDVGYVVNDLLVEHFTNIVDLKFTAKMEDDLDEVALGNKDWVKLIDDFYKPFEKNLIKKDKEIKKEDVTNLGESDEICPKCGAKMIFKLSKTGKFLSCSKFPECDGVKSLEEDIDEEVFFAKYEKAPNAEDGSEMILKSGKYGRYWAHPDYPKVKEAKPLVLIEKCPQCGKGLVERKGKWGKTFTGCSGYPECKYIKKNVK